MRRGAATVTGGEPAASVALELAVVAYDNADVLEEQIRLLEARLTDAYRHTVFDNSPSQTARRAIAALCDARGVGYVGLPSNPLSGHDPSGSHGLALNWAYKRILRRRDSACLGFLDPDVFPTRSTSVLAKLADASCWGHLQTRGERWYLWAGFSFFRRSACPRLDFMPCDGLDTGGGNWRLVFSGLQREQLIFPAHSYVDPGAPAGQSPERIGDWLHTFNSSGWREP